MSLSFKYATFFFSEKKMLIFVEFVFVNYVFLKYFVEEIFGN